MSKKNIATETIVETAAPTVAPTIKNTPVMERKFKLAVERPQNLKSKQASIVLDVLCASEDPMSISEIAPIAESKGLTAVGGVLPSVRYHLHHLTKDGVTEVVNPTITM
jgi:hypothetical protein